MLNRISLVSTFALTEAIDFSIVAIAENKSAPLKLDINLVIRSLESVFVIPETSLVKETLMTSFIQISNRFRKRAISFLSFAAIFSMLSIRSSRKFFFFNDVLKTSTHLERIVTISSSKRLTALEIEPCESEA